MISSCNLRPLLVPCLQNREHTNPNEFEFFLEENIPSDVTAWVKAVCVKPLAANSRCDVKRRRVQYTIYLDGRDAWCCDPENVIKLLQSNQVHDLFQQNSTPTNPSGNGVVLNILPIPRYCDPFTYICSRQVPTKDVYSNYIGSIDNTLVAQEINNVGNVNERCRTFSVVVEFNNMLLDGNRIIWGVSSQSPIINLSDQIQITPITNINDLDQAVCNITTSDQTVQEPVVISKFLGMRDANCTPVEIPETAPPCEDETCMACCVPLAGLECQNILPTNSAGVPFNRAVRDDTRRSITIEKPLHPSSTLLSSLQALQNSVNCNAIWVYEFRKGQIEAPPFNTNFICQCFLIPRHAAKIERVTVTDHRFCCSPIKMVSFELKIKRNVCRVFREGENGGVVVETSIDTGWESWRANQGRAELRCCNPNSPNLVPIDGGLSWLDPLGQAINPTEGESQEACATITERLENMNYVGYLDYDEFDFVDLIDPNQICMQNVSFTGDNVITVPPSLREKFVSQFPPQCPCRPYSDFVDSPEEPDGDPGSPGDDDSTNPEL